MGRHRSRSWSRTNFVLYHLDLTGAKRPCSKTNAEYREKYFCGIKISTQVLISLWKSLAREELTSHSSTLFAALHYFGASHFILRFAGEVAQ
jgi:hypothetical protein